ncbi:hypothetical protein BVRB_3g068860 isoform A [Beta vulgaris subsp. vulgaris]|nr:hypothetical protein BVRB_3g068860 isoform A [Beta vulgaris subsp. vulgaris]
MTEYWVSQGMKWCDFCKIFITDNPTTIRNHELGTRHKENVTKRLADMRTEKAAKEKQEKEAARTLQQIEAKAIRSYQKDIASQETKQSQAPADFRPGDTAWEYDSSSGYYYDENSGIQYDPKSGFYYSGDLGKWVTQEEAFAAAKNSGSKEKFPLSRPLLASTSGQPTEKKNGANLRSGGAPGPVVSGSLNPTRSIKGASSSLAVGKKKKPYDKPKAVPAGESDALKAREAARKRVEEREKSLLGLYGN